MSKVSLLIGFAVGYVVGTAQGRAQFEKIKNAAQDLWERPEVKRTVKKVDDFVADKAPGLHDVAGAVNDAAPSTPASSTPTPGAKS